MNATFRKLAAAVAIAACLGSAAPAFAGCGLIGCALKDIGNAIGGTTGTVLQGTGQAADKVNEGARKSVPVINEVERLGEGVGRTIGRPFGELFIGTGADLVLKNWITESRNDALKAGAGAMPDYIRAEFEGFIPEHILNKVRYRVGQGHELSLQANAFRFGDAAAITLGEVIVFRRADDAMNNLALWAHELGHVLQYDAWGYHTFAVRYLRDRHDVEASADDNLRRFIAWRQEQQQLASLALGDVCRTTLGDYDLHQPQTLGTVCVGTTEGESIVQGVVE